MKNVKGITLVALVITIIILLILAGISISALTNTGIFGKAQETKEVSKNAVDEQNEVLDEYEEKIEEYLNLYEEIDATTIANATDKNEYYGKYVKEYMPQNGSTVGWKIFYVDKNNIYLIADDYVDRTSLPESTDELGKTTGNIPNNGNDACPKAAYFSGILEDYTGTDRILNLVKNLNKTYFDQKFTSTGSNMKAVAYMLDTKAWSPFKDLNGKAMYAIGGPTIEMIMDSYSQKYNVQYKANAVNEIGYKVSKDNGNTWSNSCAEMIEVSDELYIPNSNGAYTMWVASPSANSDSTIMRVGDRGLVDYNSIDNTLGGFRPVVCLESDVKLQKYENGFLIK